jgi:hypothetical protein
MSGGGAEVGIHRGVGGTVSGDDNGIGEPDGETEGDDGVGCLGQVIYIYPYVPLNSPLVAGITAYFVLGEVLSPFQVLGGVGVIAAVVLLQLAREKTSPFTPLEIRQKE